jgi:hypothetical protein
VADVWLVVDEAFHAVDKDIDILDQPVPDLEDGEARWQLPRGSGTPPRSPNPGAERTVIRPPRSSIRPFMLSRKPYFPLLRSVLLGDEPHAIVATVTTSPCSPSPANTTARVARECWTNVLERLADRRRHLVDLVFGEPDRPERRHRDRHFPDGPGGGIEGDPEGGSFLRGFLGLALDEGSEPRSCCAAMSARRNTSRAGTEGSAPSSCPRLLTQASA